MHNVGDVKKTYEVIADTGCNSYSLERVPAYKLTMIGLREGTAGMAANTAKPYISSKTKSGKAVHQPTPSIMGVYRKAVRQTSVVRDFKERRKSRASIDQSDGTALVDARLNAMATVAGDNDGDPFKFQDEPRLQLQDAHLLDLEIEDQEAIDGDAFGTGLGHSKYFDDDYDEQEDESGDEYDFEAQNEQNYHNRMESGDARYEEGAEV